MYELLIFSRGIALLLLHCTTKKKFSPTLMAVGDSRVIWRPKNDAIFIFFIVKIWVFWPDYRHFRGKITKNSIRGLKNFLPGKVFPLVPFESLTSISFPGSPDKASFRQEIWSNCGNFYVLTLSLIHISEPTRPY